MQVLMGSEHLSKICDVTVLIGNTIETVPFGLPSKAAGARKLPDRGNFTNHHPPCIRCTGYTPEKQMVRAEGARRKKMVNSARRKKMANSVRRRRAPKKK